MATVNKRGAKWQATHRGPDGRERTKTFALKVDAERWVADQVSAMSRGSWIDPVAARITVTAFSNKWLGYRTDLEVRTTELYRYLLDSYVLPEFGKMQLGKVTPSAVRAWNSQLAGDHATTAAKAYRLLSQIMSTAVADEIITRNPCQVRGASVERAQERPTASIAQVEALAAQMPEHLQLTVLLASWCQLRRAEILGLRRRDIDLLHGTLSISVTRTMLMSGAMVTKAPKSDAGRRTIAIPKNIIPAISKHLDSFAGSDPDGCVINGLKGAPLLPQVLNAAWSKARNSVGLPHLRFHDLRHSGLTWSAATGASIAELMRRAGHASPAAAMRYLHATEDRDHALADALAGLDAKAKLHDVADITRTKVV